MIALLAIGAVIFASMLAFLFMLERRRVVESNTQQALDQLAHGDASAVPEILSPFHDSPFATEEQYRG